MRSARDVHGNQRPIPSWRLLVNMSDNSLLKDFPCSFWYSSYQTRPVIVLSRTHLSICTHSIGVNVRSSKRTEIRPTMYEILLSRSSVNIIEKMAEPYVMKNYDATRLRGSTSSISHLFSRVRKFKLIFVRSIYHYYSLLLVGQFC